MPKEGGTLHKEGQGKQQQGDEQQQQQQEPEALLDQLWQEAVAGHAQVNKQLLQQLLEVLTKVDPSQIKVKGGPPAASQMYQQDQTVVGKGGMRVRDLMQAQQQQKQRKQKQQQGQAGREGQAGGKKVDFLQNAGTWSKLLFVLGYYGYQQRQQQQQQQQEEEVEGKMGATAVASSVGTGSSSSSSKVSTQAEGKIILEQVWLEAVAAAATRAADTAQCRSNGPGVFWALGQLGLGQRLLNPKWLQALRADVTRVTPWREWLQQTQAVAVVGYLEVEAAWEGKGRVQLVEGQVQGLVDVVEGFGWEDVVRVLRAVKKLGVMEGESVARGAGGQGVTPSAKTKGRVQQETKEEEEQLGRLMSASLARLSHFAATGQLPQSAAAEAVALMSDLEFDWSTLATASVDHRTSSSRASVLDLQQLLDLLSRSTDSTSSSSSSNKGLTLRQCLACINAAAKAGLVDAGVKLQLQLLPRLEELLGEASAGDAAQMFASLVSLATAKAAMTAFGNDTVLPSVELTAAAAAGAGFKVTEEVTSTSGPSTGTGSGTSGSTGSDTRTGGGATGVNTGGSIGKGSSVEGSITGKIGLRQNQLMQRCLVRMSGAWEQVRLEELQVLPSYFEALSWSLSKSAAAGYLRRVHELFEALANGAPGELGKQGSGRGLGHEEVDVGVLLLASRKVMTLAGLRDKEVESDAGDTNTVTDSVTAAGDTTTTGADAVAGVFVRNEEGVAAEDEVGEGDGVDGRIGWEWQDLEALCVAAAAAAVANASELEPPDWAFIVETFSQ
jgi:hypothetical protein